MNSEKNKVLVIGTGSIGERHAKNLHSLGKEVSLFDLDQNKANLLSKNEGFVVVPNIDVTTLKQFGTIFVCTPSHLHIEPAKISLQAGCHLFIEKPIAVKSSNELKEIDYLAEKSKLTTLIGCNMRFHPSIQKLKNILDSKSLGKIYSVHVYAGQFLPFWRKVDYQQTYSAKAAFGGGMLLEGIHELDYICWLFGKVEEIYASTTKISDLKIDAEDLAEVIIKFKNGIIGHIHLDCLQKQKRRGYEVIGEHQTITWESIGNAPEKSIVRIFGSQNEEIEVIESIIDPNSMYVDELRYFFDCIENNTETINNIHNAISVLQLVEAAKLSTKQKTAINVS